MRTHRHIALCSLLALACVIAVPALVSAQTPAAPAAAAPAAKPAGTPAAPASLDAILKQVALYDGGIESAAMWQLRDYVYARKDDAAGRAEVEAKLLAFLKTPASPVARMAACRYLRLIAGDTAVPALQAMLTDARWADLAIYALQGIPGAASEQALIKALDVTTGATRIEIVATLGERRSAAAVPALTPLLQQAAMAPAAAVALGRIGGDTAVTPLAAARTGASPALKPVITGALLEAAGRFVTAKNTTAALKVYEPLAADATLPSPQRQAAIIGHIRSSASVAVLMEYLGVVATGTTVLSGDAAGLSKRVTTIVADDVTREAAIALLPAIAPAEFVRPAADHLPKLSDSLQVQLIAVLSGYPPELVKPALLQAARSGAPPVRLAALKAIGSVGGAAEVPLLAGVAADAKGAEQAAARAALASLKGRAVDDAIVAMLGKKPTDAVAGELLLAIGDRRIFSAKSLVVSAVASPAPAIRLQAYRGLRTIGTPSDIPAVLDALLATTDEMEENEAEKTVVALAQKIAGPDGRARFVRSRLDAEKAPAVRARLMGVMGMVGDPATLPLYRAALQDPAPEVYDAAVRALAGWPTAAAREDLLALARDTRTETHRLLAIRGLIRVIGLDPYRDPRAAVADLKLAAGFAWRPDEQKLVLSALTQFPCQEALETAAGFQRDPSVSAEAKAAVDRITARLPKEASRK